MELLEKLLNTESETRKHFNSKDFHVLDIQDVANYYYFGNDQEVWRVDQDLPRVTPPWPNIYMEWKMPDKIVSREAGDTSDATLGHSVIIGHMVMTLKMRDDARVLKVVDCEKESESNDPFEIAAKKVIFYDEDKDSVYSEKLKWITTTTTFFCINREIKMVGNCLYFLLENGNIFFPTKKGGSEKDIFIPTTVGLNTVQASRELSQYINDLEKIMWMAMCFCNCKNIKLMDGPRPSRQVRRAAERTGRQIVDKYYTLEIKAMRDVLRQTMDNEGTGIKKALHICRGHFKEFTKDHPLFGKHTGTYWWDMQLKGSADKGRVEKDYKVKK